MVRRVLKQIGNDSEERGADGEDHRRLQKGTTACAHVGADGADGADGGCVFGAPCGSRVGEGWEKSACCRRLRVAAGARSLSILAPVRVLAPCAGSGHSLSVVELAPLARCMRWPRLCNVPAPACAFLRLRARSRRHVLDLPLFSGRTPSPALDPSLARVSHRMRPRSRRKHGPSCPFEKKTLYQKRDAQRKAVVYRRTACNVFAWVKGVRCVPDACFASR